MITVVIPALNEEVNIRASVLTVTSAAEAAGGVPLEVILVNDGSTDRTGDICDQLAQEFSFVRVIHHPTNMGHGTAVQEAIRLAKYDHLTMVPGDNALSFYTIRNLFLNRDKADYVMAMIINTEYRPARRILLSAIFSHFYTTTFGLPIKYINAPALWPISMLRQMGLRARRYSLHGEINVKLLRQPISFLEIDGYMNPAIFKSSAVRFRNVVDVMYSYLRLCFEIFVAKRNQYSSKAKRVLPPGVMDWDPGAEDAAPQAHNQRPADVGGRRGPMIGRHVGLDLDNTIMNYDEAFVEVGTAIGLLPSGHGLRTKDEVKSFLCTTAPGDQAWMRLQGQVYGRHIDRAQLCDGIAEFLWAMRNKGARLSIVSHKTRYGHFDPSRIDLWDAAQGWLEKQGFFAASGFGLDRNDLHFSETREGKIATIARIGCQVFIDDLPEVLLHPHFPAQTIGIWFAGARSISDSGGLVPHRNWAEVFSAVAPLL